VPQPVPTDVSREASPDLSTGPAADVFRGRRGRTTPAVRRLFAQATLAPADLVLPVFVKQDLDVPAPISSMPGVHQHSVASAVELVGRARDVGVTAFLVFGIPATKDAVGTSGWDDHGPVPAATRAIRAAHDDQVVVMADVCLCEYTDHGHCGPVAGDGVVDNDAAVAGYVRATRCYARAGVDLVAPSGMMDGQVAAMRGALDADGFRDLGIVAYAAKYQSSFYGPFREAAESGMSFGDRATHQMDPANGREAGREIAADLDEGADAIIVKPALPYLDVIARARPATSVPILGYQVSGEYAMIAAAGERGWIDADAAMHEAVLGIRRAGADAVITYAAVELAERVT